MDRCQFLENYKNVWIFSRPDYQTLMHKYFSNLAYNLVRTVES